MRALAAVVAAVAVLAAGALAAVLTTEATAPDASLRIAIAAANGSDEDRADADVSRVAVSAQGEVAGAPEGMPEELIEAAQAEGTATVDGWAAARGPGGFNGFAYAVVAPVAVSGGSTSPAAYGAIAVLAALAAFVVWLLARPVRAAMPAPAASAPLQAPPIPAPPPQPPPTQARPIPAPPMQATAAQAAAGADEVGSDGAGVEALIEQAVAVRDLVANLALANRLGAGLTAVGVDTYAPDVGAAFDADHHVAVDTVEPSDGAVPGTVASVDRVGYVRAGQLVRRPEVVVYKEVGS